MLIAFTPATGATHTTPYPGGLPERNGTETTAKGVVSQFFHPKSGELIASLRIESIRVGFDKEGLYRVPWRTTGELSDVTMEVVRPEEWNAVSGQVREALTALGRARLLRLPRFRILVAGNAPFSLEAVEAELAGEGLVWLRQVECTAGGTLKRSRRVGIRLFDLLPAAWLEAVVSPPVSGEDPDGRRTSP